MKYLPTFLCLLFTWCCLSTVKGQDCSETTMNTELCSLGKDPIPFDLRNGNLTTLVSNGSSTPTTQMGVYNGISGQNQLLHGWDQGVTIYGVYDQEASVLIASDYESLVNMGFTYRSDEEAAEFNVYGMDPTAYHYGSTGLTFCIGAGQTTRLMILAATIGLPANSTLAPITYNDMLEVPGSTIFRLEWAAPGSNNCQTFDYSFNFRY